MDSRHKMAFICTFLGTALFALYVTYDLRSPVLFVLSLSLLFGPAAYLASQRRRRSVPLILTIVATGTLQSVWLFGSGYMQGTDGVVHTMRSRNYFAGSSTLYDPTRSTSEQNPLLYSVTQIGVIVGDFEIHTFQLLLTVMIGALTILGFYCLLARVLDQQHALLSIVLLATSAQFISNGNQLRTSTMAIGIVMLVFFICVPTVQRDRTPRWMIITSISVMALYLTHIVVSLHYFLVGLLIVAALAAGRLFPWATVPHLRLRGVISLSIVLFVAVSAFLTGAIGSLSMSFGGAVVSILDVIFTSADGGLSGGDSGSNAATGSGAGLFIFFGIWVWRLIFIASALIVTAFLVQKLFGRSIPLIDVVLLTGCAVYLIVAVLLMMTGDSPISPSRIYRYLEFFAAIVITRAIVLLGTLYPALKQHRHTIFTIFIIFFAVAGLATTTVYTVDSGLREGGELPYTDYSDSEVALAETTAAHVDEEAVIYGDLWSWRLFGAYGNHEPLRNKYVSPDDNRVSGTDMVYFTERDNQRQYIKYNQQFVQDSDRIYSNNAVSLHRAPGAHFDGNVTERHA
jgi:hypothetical protein